MQIELNSFPSLLLTSESAAEAAYLEKLFQTTETRFIWNAWTDGEKRTVEIFLARKPKGST